MLHLLGGSVSALEEQGIEIAACRLCVRQRLRSQLLSKCQNTREELVQNCLDTQQELSFDSWKLSAALGAHSSSRRLFCHFLPIFPNRMFTSS